MMEKEKPEIDNLILNSKDLTIKVGKDIFLQNKKILSFIAMSNHLIIFVTETREMCIFDSQNK